jgi:hypothetical protein
MNGRREPMRAASFSQSAEKRSSTGQRMATTLQSSVLAIS